MQVFRHRGTLPPISANHFIDHVGGDWTALGLRFI